MAFSGPHGVEFNQLSSDTVSRDKLGAKIETADGRIFRFCENNGTNAMVAGDLQQAPALVTTHQDMAVAAAASAGATAVTVTLGATNAVTAGDYDGGYLLINAGAGAGHTYLVKSTPAAAASADIVITLAEPVAVALATATSKACLIPNLYKKVLISATAQTGTAVGVAPLAVPASSFGWLQTRGIAAVRADEVTTAGDELTVGTGVAGEVEGKDAIAEQVIGIAYQAGVDNERRAVFLKID